MLGVAEVCRALGAERDQVKMWAWQFNNYLSKHANPKKGKPRKFTAEDLLVLAYVSWHWEEQPDFENINAGLNCNYQYEMAPYVLPFGIPLFQEPPEELDETWRSGSLLGGIVGDPDMFTLAESFKRASDVLVEAALTKADPNGLLYPIFFNYRHAVELYLKAILCSSDQTHNIGSLLQKLSKYLEEKYGKTLPPWFKETLLTIDEFDPSSTIFRYGEPIKSHRTGDSGEFWLDLGHLRKRMESISDGFRSMKRWLERENCNELKDVQDPRGLC